MTIDELRKCVAAGPPAAPTSENPGTFVHCLSAMITDYRQKEDKEPSAIAVGSMLAMLIDQVNYQTTLQIYRDGAEMLKDHDAWKARENRPSVYQVARDEAELREAAREGLVGAMLHAINSKKQ